MPQAMIIGRITLPHARLPTYISIDSTRRMESNTWKEFFNQRGDLAQTSSMFTHEYAAVAHVTVFIHTFFQYIETLYFFL